MPEATSSHRTDANQPLYRGGIGAPLFYEVKINDWLEGEKILKHPEMVDFFTVSDVHSEIKTSSKAIISKNESKNGIEIRFSAKPEPEILGFLKGTIKARWHWKKKIWYCKYTAEKMNQLEGLLV